MFATSKTANSRVLIAARTSTVRKSACAHHSGMHLPRTFFWLRLDKSQATEIPVLGFLWLEQPERGAAETLAPETSCPPHSAAVQQRQPPNSSVPHHDSGNPLEP